MYTERENPFLFICHPTRRTTPSPHLSTPHRHFLAPAARVDIGRDCCSHCWYSMLNVSRLLIPHAAVLECGRSSSFLFWVLTLTGCLERLRTLQSPGTPLRFLVFYFFHINLTLRYYIRFVHQIVNWLNNRILRCLIIFNGKNTVTPLFWVIINILGF